jgi:diaminohydroxyphosphoribosylaminopyrimidine deaminase/5-amino-6-(5-phosphoribosylamino)uracil reductase
VQFKWRPYSLDERRCAFSLCTLNLLKGQGFYLKRKSDIDFMRQALTLAQLAEGQVGHDPLVGAMFVRNQTIITKGYHEKLYGLHAEFAAFKSQDFDVTGCTVYVTLEPCAHDDYFPSCAQFLIRKRVKKVVIASLDPNPIENGDGVKLLQAAGITVVTGVLDTENRLINQAYFERF